ncbi:hypothetical protein VTK73DRAFT_6136 [Phialemonium thermophilum]|uniref:lytic cellulose monooxygenase (C4-dehydrogenating) n=1 Tax=Phialemonium thermophilum TaxID=223376 RepID=A0ABR3WKZ4_9PEZI
MKKASCFSLALLSSVASVAAHATFQKLWVNGVDDDQKCVRVVPSNSPVTDVTSTDMVCNVGGSKGVAGVCEATAGQSMAVEMHQQPHDRSCSTEAIGGNHFGPVMVYMSKVDDTTKADGTSAPWFKVSEFGYDADNKTWGTDMLNQNCGKHTFIVPSKIPPGDYLVRAEAIALHAASQPNGAQLYMSCYQIRLNSSGDQLPAGVKFPGAYKPTDPGIQVDIYGSNFKSYTIPGPAIIDQSFF